MRSSIHASLLIATCAIVGATAISLPSFEVGTWELVDSDGDASWTADKFVQLKNGTFTGEGTWGGSAYTYYGDVEAHTCAKATDGTMSTVEAFWWVSSGDYTNTPGMMWMNCVYITWSGSDASRTSTGRFRSAEVPIGTPLGECPAGLDQDFLQHFTPDIPFMEVYGEVTRLDQLTYKCVADCEPQPWDSCDAASKSSSTPSASPTTTASQANATAPPHRPGRGSHRWHGL